jgi:group I intron endonuclease
MKVEYDLGSGVYQIRNLVNGHIYIGHATSFYYRWHEHLSELRNNHHYNDYLQNAWNKYGEENFVFEILTHCSTEIMVWYEQAFMDLMNPEYNICKIAESTVGFKHSEETKQQMRETRKGAKRSPETCLRISLGTTGVPKTYKNGKKPRVTSEETKQKLRDVRLGTHASEETKNKLSEAGRKRTHSEETKARMRIAQKLRWDKVRAQKQIINEGEQ